MQGEGGGTGSGERARGWHAPSATIHLKKREGESEKGQRGREKERVHRIERKRCILDEQLLSFLFFSSPSRRPNAYLQLMKSRGQVIRRNTTVTHARTDTYRHRMCRKCKQSAFTAKLDDQRAAGGSNLPLAPPCAYRARHNLTDLIRRREVHSAVVMQMRKMQRSHLLHPASVQVGKTCAPGRNALDTLHREPVQLLC